MLDDGSSCTDDGLPCTTDGCHGGARTHGLMAGACAIQGVCYASGDRNPSNSCQSCQPSLDPGAWRNADGLACEDDGISCTSDACLSGACTHALAVGNCLINGECFASGDTNPANVCQTCAPAISTAGWTANEGAPCADDGLSCTMDSCASDACGHVLLPGYCVIDATCVLDGAANPADVCQTCDPAVSADAWTTVASCGSDGGVDAEPDVGEPDAQPDVVQNDAANDATMPDATMGDAESDAEGDALAPEDGGQGAAPDATQDATAEVGGDDAAGDGEAQDGAGGGNGGGDGEAQDGAGGGGAVQDGGEDAPDDAQLADATGDELGEAEGGGSDGAGVDGSPPLDGGVVDASSSDAAEGGAGTPADLVADGDGGCACSAAGAPDGDDGPGLLVVAAALLMLGQRRRRCSR